MRLEIKSGTISTELDNELGVSAFLSKIEQDISILPHKILAPLDKASGVSHFDDLNSLASKLSTDQKILAGIMEKTKALPNLENHFAFWKNSNLSPHHLFQLGSFLEKEQYLVAIEKDFALDSDFHDALHQMLTILQNNTNHNFGAIRTGVEDEVLKQGLNTKEKELAIELSIMEQKIEEQTGLKMVYPYPKEIECNHPQIDKIRACNLLSIQKVRNHLLLEYSIPDSLRLKLDEKNRLLDQFSISINRRIEKINTLLRPYLERFNNYYQKRVDRSFLYTLLSAVQRLHLTLPAFTEQIGISIVNGTLPHYDNFTPQNIELTRGASVLYGANMSGKTTVLKMLFFNLMLVKLGLPVPCHRLTCNFPEEIFFHLKTSGNTKNKLSSFAEELDFFSREFKEGSIVLVDELFHSTEPLSGVELSKIILEEFNQKRLIFFCNSQYPEVLYFRVNLFRMKDAPILAKQLMQSDELLDHLSLKDLLNNIPYEIERLSSGDITQREQESWRPMLLALHFPLPATLKEKIKLWLKNKR